jgi:hypothetical protein
LLGHFQKQLAHFVFLFLFSLLLKYHGIRWTLAIYQNGKNRVNIALITATVAAVAATSFVTLAYIPSSIGTVLKFRSGLIGSLHDADFKVYRYALDQTTMLFGSALWGVVSTAIVMFCGIGFFAFLLIYEVKYALLIYLF